MIKIKFLNIIALVLIMSIPVFNACSHADGDHNHGQETSVNEHDNHDHEAEAEDKEHLSDGEEHSLSFMSFTLSQNGYELFMEMPFLIVNESASLIIHITNLADYKPIKAEEVNVSLEGKEKYTTEAQSHTQGIFNAMLTPKQTGLYVLHINFTDNNSTGQFIIDSLMVYATHDNLPKSESEEAGLISYLKEKAWKEDFGIYKVSPQPFSRVIKTSGEILPAPGDETIITALHSGTISLKNLLIEGMKVKKGDVIGIISSDLIHQNLTNDYLEAKNKYEKANSDFERAKKLIDEKLISEREFLEARLNYESTKNAFNNIAKFYSDGNENVKAGNDGFIRSVFVREGQFIQEGQPIATIIQNKKIVLKVDVPQQYNHLASGFYAANFSPTYTDKMYNTQNLNGHRISYSSALPANSLFTSVNFEFDASTEIMPGSFCEVYLKSAATSDALIIPVSSLMEDQGNYYVFVMVDGEHYKKTFITKGNSDGEFVEVLSGLEADDVIVSKGTYKVFLASMGNSAPAHTHAH